MRKTDSPPIATVDEYFMHVPEPAHTALGKVRAAIRSAVPAEATECISYGMPAFRYKGALVGYAAFRNHCSFFPMNSAIVKQFSAELRGFETAKGTIRFTPEKPLPPALIKKMVKIRVAENEEKKKP